MTREETLNKYINSHPWWSIYFNIKARCNNKKHPRYIRYGARGIKCFLTLDIVKELWFRDKAYEMKKPSIDRIDNDGNYTFANCKFIEHKINSAKDISKTVLQYDLKGNFIKKWCSTREAARQLKLTSTNIASCARGKLKKSQGFIWRYK